jgi:hypothetical protein
MGIEIPAKLISSVAAAYQKGAMISHRQVEQETGAEWDVRHIQATGSFGRYEGSFSLQFQLAHREESQPDTAAPGAPIKAEALLEVADLGERSEFERAGLLRCRRRCDCG